MIEGIESRSFRLEKIKAEGIPKDNNDIEIILTKEREWEHEKPRKKALKVYLNFSLPAKKINIERIIDTIDYNESGIYIDERNRNKEFYNNLLKSRKIDIKRGFTSTGIHRDDIDILINNEKVDIYGSQGQQKTSILSLKIAELNIICDEIGEKPILLLDDFMSELDGNRRGNLLNNISDSQVFITCTDKININERDDIIYKIENGIKINI